MEMERDTGRMEEMERWTDIFNLTLSYAVAFDQTSYKQFIWEVAESPIRKVQIQSDSTHIRFSQFIWLKIH